MDFSDLIAKFPANRLLSENEKIFNLKQKTRLNIVPHYQLSVIKLNSTYLETVDKWYGWKGLTSAVSIIIIIILSSALGLIAIEWLLEGFGIFSSTVESGVLLANGFGMSIVLASLVWAVTWLLLKESFAYTHYLIRFNRKTRTVYVFRTNGKILSVPWDEIFCMPVDQARESLRMSVERVFANFAGAPFLIYLMMFPFCAVVSIFRVVAMQTSKIPEWPETVEERCFVEHGDPYANVGSPDGERVPVFPDAAAAAGVGFCAPTRNCQQA